MQATLSAVRQASVTAAVAFRPPIPNAISLFSYQPETIRDVELGLKSDFRLGDWRVRTNLAAYHQWLDDAQLNQTFGVGTANVSALVNAASAKIKGMEAEVTIAPTSAFNMMIAYAYTKAKYGAFLDYSRRDPGTNGPTEQGRRIRGSVRLIRSSGMTNSSGSYCRTVERLRSLTSIRMP